MKVWFGGTGMLRLFTGSGEESRYGRGMTSSWSLGELAGKLGSFG